MHHSEPTMGPEYVVIYGWSERSWNEKTVKSQFDVFHQYFIYNVLTCLHCEEEPRVGLSALFSSESRCLQAEIESGDSNLIKTKAPVE